MVLEKTLESPLDSKEIKTFNPKGNPPWIFIGRTDAEAEVPILWPPDVKNWLIGKDPDVGKDWGQEEKEATEDEMVGWHHWLNRQEFEQTQGDSERQESLVCCSSWGHKKSDLTWDWRTTTLAFQADSLPAEPPGKPECEINTYLLNRILFPFYFFCWFLA